MGPAARHLYDTVDELREAVAGARSAVAQRPRDTPATTTELVRDADQGSWAESLTR